MSELVTLDEIESAYRRVGDRAHHTPTISARTIGAELGLEMWLKAELFQRTGSFKIRGVLNTLLLLSPEELANGVVTMSAGNHAAALAAGSAIIGTTASIVMPATANEFKVAATRRYGGSPVLTDRPLHDVMMEIADTEKRFIVHPFDDLRIIAGAAGVGVELVNDAPPLDLVVVPVGGGGLISGVSAAVKLRSPDTRVVGVEPTGANTMTRALAAGEPVTITPDTICDGLAPPFAGAATLAHAQAYVDDVVTIDDELVIPALRMLYERAKLAAEPSGAAGLAALLGGAIDVGDAHRVACVVSGGNIDLGRLAALVSA
jgi:threonine dehydratase